MIPELISFEPVCHEVGLDLGAREVSVSKFLRQNQRDPIWMIETFLYVCCNFPFLDLMASDGMDN